MIINSFEIVGEVWVNEKGCYKCNALCKVCQKEFSTNYHALKRMISCGCARPSQLVDLGAYVNGFKILKCHGYDTKRGVRWATVECKVCRKEYESDPNKLRYRKHCGCMRKGIVACRYAKSHPQLAQTIKHMMSRCYKQDDQDYHNYGARGIKVCEEWLADRNTFCEWAIKNGFENNKNLSIDRIDSDKDYMPENCRWANAAIQARNTRRNVLTMKIAAQMRKDRQNMNLRDVAMKYGVSYSTASNVINNRSWVQ